MLIDDMFRGCAILVEARCGHRGLELPDLRFTLGDTAFQVGDALLECLGGPLLLLPLGLQALADFAVVRFLGAGFGFRAFGLALGTLCGGLGASFLAPRSLRVSLGPEP